MTTQHALPYLLRLPVPPVTSANTGTPVVASEHEKPVRRDHLALAKLMHAVSQMPSINTVLVDVALPMWEPSADTVRAVQEWFGHYQPAVINVGVPAWYDPTFYPMVQSHAPASVFIAPPAIAGTQIQQEALINAVRRFFPTAKLSLSNHSDSEEGWTRPLLRVESGMNDLDKLDDLEQKFYEEVERHETLKSALNSTTILFV